LIAKATFGTTVKGRDYDERDETVQPLTPV